MKPNTKRYKQKYITPTIKISWGEIDKVDKENLTAIEKQNCLVESYKLPSPNFVVVPTSIDMYINIFSQWSPDTVPDPSWHEENYKAT